MQATPDTFIDFGGHRASGGFSVREDSVFFLEERLNTAYAARATADHTADTPAADLSLAPHEADAALLSRLERFAPFGMGNPKPVVALRGALLIDVSWFGKSGEHLRLALAADEFGAPLEAVSFYAKRTLGARTDALTPGRAVTVSGSLERDQFKRGQPVRMRLLAVE